MKMDEIFNRNILPGNYHPLPDTDMAVKQYCSTNPLSSDDSWALEFLSKLNPKTKSVFMLTNTPGNVKQFCHLKDPVKLGITVNNKLPEMKRIRDNAVGHLNKIINTEPNTANVLCTLKAFIDQTAALFDDQSDGSRAFIRLIMTIYIQMLEMVTKSTGVLSGKCDITNGYKYNTLHKHQTFLLPLILAFNKTIVEVGTENDIDNSFNLHADKALSGRLLPETSDNVKLYCDQLKNHHVNNIETLISFISTIKNNKIKAILYSQGSSDNDIFCSSPDPISLARVINAKVSQIKQLRDDAVGRIIELTDNFGSISDVMCIVNLLINKVENLFPENDLGRQYFQKSLNLLKGRVIVGEKISGKASERCDFSNGNKRGLANTWKSTNYPVVKAFMKLLDTDSIDIRIDDVYNRLFLIGNGRPLPEAPNAVKQACAELMSNIPKDMSIVTQLLALLMPKAKSVAQVMERPDIQANMQLFCKSPDPSKLARSINVKHTQIKQIHYKTMAHLDNIIGGDSNMPDALCTIKSYANQIETLFNEEDDARDYARQMMTVYREMVSAAEQLSVKASPVCNINDPHKVDSKNSFITILVPIAKVFNKFLDDDMLPQRIDELYSRLFRLGSGQPFPVTDNELKNYCNEFQASLSTESAIATKFMNTLNPMTKAVTFSLFRGDSFGKIMSFCQSSNAIQMAVQLNTKMSETNRLRDNAVGKLIHLVQNGSSQMPEMLCIIKSFANQMVNLYDNKDGARDYANRMMSIVRELAETVEYITEQSSDKCDLSDGHQYIAHQYKYKSYVLPILKVFNTVVDKSSMNRLRRQETKSNLVRK